MNTVHSKLDQSKVIRDWHARFHSFIEKVVVHSLKANGINDHQAGTLATVATFLLEGLLAHPHTEAQRDDLLEWFAQHTRANRD